MDSEHRAVSICFVMAFTAIVLLAFIISSCSIRQSQIDAPTAGIRAQLEHTERMACIAKNGRWDYVSGSSHFACNFDKD